MLAGGRSRRFGAYKLSAPLHGRAVLAATVRELPQQASVVVVGPPRGDLGRPVSFVREDPPLAGPAAALAAGLREVLSGSATVVGVLPGDAPYAGRGLASLASALTEGVHVVVAVDPAGVEQPLQLLLDREGAQAWLAAAGDATNASARAVLHRVHLPVTAVALPAGQIRDIDTPADLSSLASAPTDELRNARRL